MTEELLSHPVVEVGDGDPLPEVIPTASGTKRMDMWMKSSRLAKGLDDRNHAGSEVWAIAKINNI